MGQCLKAAQVLQGWQANCICTCGHYFEDTCTPSWSPSTHVFSRTFLTFDKLVEDLLKTDVKDHQYQTCS
jgi:hypothetical protein